MKVSSLILLLALVGQFGVSIAKSGDRLFGSSRHSRVHKNQFALDNLHEEGPSKSDVENKDHDAQILAQMLPKKARVLQTSMKLPIGVEPAKRKNSLIVRTSVLTSVTAAAGLVPGATKFAVFRGAKSAATASDSDFTYVGKVEISAANVPEYVVVSLPSGAVIDNSYLAIGEASATQTVTGTTLFVSDKVVYFSDSKGSGAKTISIVMAIVLMVASCCCWICGVPQFYHLIKVAQMLYMKVLLASPKQATILFWVLSGFHMNIFSVVPNPVKINEPNGNSCQPSPQFFAEELSCHVYNTLRNYVLGFLIYLILYFFIHYNVYDDSEFWKNLKDITKINMFMLAIFPDVCIGIFGNLASSASNSVLSVGVMFSIALILWYVHIFNWAIQSCINGKKDAVEFVSYFIFSRSPQTEDDPQLNKKVVAIFMEYLKIFIVVMMIGLFNSAPKTQLVIIFLVYILHGIYLLVVRPYANLFHNILLAVSDLAFFIMMLLSFVTNSYEETGKENSIETGFGDAQVAMVAIILLANLILYVLPIGVGQDLSGSVSPSSPPREASSKAYGGDEAEQQLSGHKSSMVKEPHHVPKGDDPLNGKDSATEDKLIPTRMKSNSGKVLGGGGADQNKTALPPPNVQTRQEEEPMKPKTSENPLISSGTKSSKLPPIAGPAENQLEKTSAKDLKASSPNFETPKINNLLGGPKKLDQSDVDPSATAKKSENPMDKKLIDKEK